MTVVAPSARVMLAEVQASLVVASAGRWAQAERQIADPIVVG